MAYNLRGRIFPDMRFAQKPENYYFIFGYFQQKVTTKLDEKRKSASVLFLFLDFYYCAEFQKSVEKNPIKVGYRDLQADGYRRTDKYEFHRTSPAGSPKKLGLYDRWQSCAVIK